VRTRTSSTPRRGCVGLATDEEIEELAGWIASRGVDEVEIF
jgi:hypothetical protein